MYSFSVKRLNAALVALNLTPYAGARRCDIEPQTLYKWLNSSGVPSGQTLCKLASGLGVEPGYFFEKEIS